MDYFLRGIKFTNRVRHRNGVTRFRVGEAGVT